MCHVRRLFWFEKTTVRFRASNGPVLSRHSHRGRTRCLTRCIERGEGVGMVIGPTGTGKSLLCRLLAEQFKETFPVAELSCGRLSTRRSLFQAILYKLGQPYRGMDEGELRIALVDYLTLGKVAVSGNGVDRRRSPHLAPAFARRNPNDDQPGRAGAAAGAIGIGRKRLAGRAVRRSKNGIFQSADIHALLFGSRFNRSETQDYIHAQIDLAGGCGMDLFSEDTCQSVYKATDGVPRLINQLCDHALLVAYVAGRRTIEPAQIEEAWADLQQLPTPGTATANANQAA